MGAPEGNQFWKLRSKHGRSKLFATSKLLWDAACEYFKWCDENPWVRKETITKNVKGVIFVDEKELPTARPYTLTGLAIYLNASSSYWREFRKNLKDNEEDFLSVVTCIEEIIYTQKYEGAAVGAFNASIIARDLGLTDKSEVENTNINKTDLSGLTYEELQKLKESDNTGSND